MQGRYRSKFLKRASLRSSRALSLSLPLLPILPHPHPLPRSLFSISSMSHNSFYLSPPYLYFPTLLSSIYWILDFLTFSAYPFCPSFPFISFPFPFFTPSLSSSYYPSLPSLPLSFPPLLCPLSFHSTFTTLVLEYERLNWESGFFCHFCCKIWLIFQRSKGHFKSNLFL